MAVQLIDTKTRQFEHNDIGTALKAAGRWIERSRPIVTGVQVTRSDFFATSFVQVTFIEKQS